MLTKIASPKTNPAITGRERNWVMKPRRHSPATMNIRPVMTMRADANTA